MGDPRPGETLLPFDPGARADGSVSFIGVIRTSWGPDNCPKNIRAARESGNVAVIELREGYEPGLTGLKVGQAVIALYWMDKSRRDIIVQRPRHTDGPRGVFSLRSPARPNPVAMSTVRITGLDPEARRIEIDAIDVFDGTPLIDLKPWIDTIDLPPSK